MVLASVFLQILVGANDLLPLVSNNHTRSLGQVHNNYVENIKCFYLYARNKVLRNKVDSRQLDTNHAVTSKLSVGIVFRIPYS